MPKSSKPAPPVKLAGLSVKDPRVVMRALIGALLVANLVVAVIAFKPFGGSADDLRKDQSRLSGQLRQLETRLEATKDHVTKIKIAHDQGQAFLDKYIMDKRSASAITVDEMIKAATGAGVRFLPENANYEDIEGSDTLQMMSITAPFEGSYAGIAKLVNTLEKSPRFLIIDTIRLDAPQQQNGPQAAAGQNVNVSVKLLTFVRDEPGGQP